MPYYCRQEQKLNTHTQTHMYYIYAIILKYNSNIYESQFPWAITECKLMVVVSFLQNTSLKNIVMTLNRNEHDPDFLFQYIL